MNKLMASLGVAAVACLTACTVEATFTPVETESSSSVDSFDPASSNANGGDNGSLSSAGDILSEITPCAFTATDAEWNYSLKSTGSDGISGSIDIAYKIDGTNAIRIETAEVSGGTASMVCRLMGSERQVKDVNGDSSLVTDQYCEGSTMIRITTKKLANVDVQKLFAAESQSCKVVNGLAEDVVPTVALSTSCGFKATDAEWSFTYMDGSALRRKTYKPSVEEGYVYSYNDEITIMSYAACKKTLPLEENTNFCSEEGLVSRGSSAFRNDDPTAYYTTATQTCVSDAGLPADTAAADTNTVVPASSVSNGPLSSSVAAEVVSSSAATEVSSSSVSISPLSSSVAAEVPSSSESTPVVGGALTCLHKTSIETLCFIAPVTTSQADFNAFCAEENGTIGTTCPSGKTLECVGPKTGNTIYYYDEIAPVMGCEMMMSARD